MALFSIQGFSVTAPTVLGGFSKPAGSHWFLNPTLLPDSSRAGFLQEWQKWSLGEGKDRLDSSWFYWYFLLFSCFYLMLLAPSGRALQ